MGRGQGQVIASLIGRREMRESYVDVATRSIVTLSPAFGSENKWWVNRVSVPPEHRGCKIASGLLQQVLADADKNNVTLRLHVIPDVSGTGLDFETLHAFYLRYGFQDKDTPGNMIRYPHTLAK